MKRENTYKSQQLLARVMDLAKASLGGGDMVDSAELCYRDACSLMQDVWGKYDIHSDKTHYAGERALTSLAYSVGKFSPVYQEAQKILNNPLKESEFI